MANPVLFAASSLAATVTTEHFLSSPSAVGTYTFHVDLVNMVAGDVVEVRVYQMVLTGGTPRVSYLDVYQGAQPTDGLIAVSVPLGNDLTDASSLRFSIKQTLGTSRNFPWKVLQYT